MKRPVIRSIFLVLALWSFFAPSVSFAQSTASTINFDGDTRTFYVHTPAHYDPSKRYPLMVVFHGAYGNAQKFELTSGFDKIADQYGFFALYPEANGPKWKLAGPHNDIFYGAHLLEVAARQYPIDTTRVYLSGFSQGGGIAEGITCYNTDRIAGLAVVGQNLNQQFQNLCHPSHAVSFVLFHGTADPVSPYEGGANGTSGARTFTAEQSAEFWARNNNCTGAPAITSFADKLSDGTSQTSNLSSWTACDGQTFVSFYTIHGGGHTWPGGLNMSQELGPTSQTVNASEIIWKTLSQVSGR